MFVIDSYNSPIYHRIKIPPLSQNNLHFELWTFLFSALIPLCSLCVLKICLIIYHIKLTILHMFYHKCLMQDFSLKIFLPSQSTIKSRVNSHSIFSVNLLGTSSPLNWSSLQHENYHPLICMIISHLILLITWPNTSLLTLRFNFSSSVMIFQPTLPARDWARMKVTSCPARSPAPVISTPILFLPALKLLAFLRTFETLFALFLFSASGSWQVIFSLGYPSHHLTHLS